MGNSGDRTTETVDDLAGESPPTDDRFCLVSRLRCRARRSSAMGRQEPSVDRSRSSRPFYSKSNDYKRQLHIAMRSDTFNAD